MYVRRVVSLRIIVVGFVWFCCRWRGRREVAETTLLVGILVANCVCEIPVVVSLRIKLEYLKIILVSILGYCICRKCHLSLLLLQVPM